MNYYERHLGDYARDTAHLSILEHGVYSLLLDRYYATESPIPAEQVHRLARARSPDEIAAVDSVLSEFFILIDGFWTNRRADEEIVKASQRIEAARANGTKGGRPKRNPEVTQQKPTGFPTETQPFPKQNPAETQPLTQTKPRSKLSMLHAPCSMLQEDQEKGELTYEEKKNGRTFKRWIESLPEGEDAIPATDPVFAYALKAGIPLDFLGLSWAEFHRRMSDSQKRYKSWPRAYRNYVENNYFDLWRITPEGDYVLTNKGLQAKKVAS